MGRSALLGMLVLGWLGGIPSVVGGSPCRAAAAAPGRGRTTAAAPGIGHAGLVVQTGDGSSREFCFEIAEPGLTGLDLLRRSGLEVVYQDAGGGQITLCRIAGQGCDYPSVPCFCQCADPRSGCRFWGYYVADPATGALRFSDVGAASRTVQDGDVDVWVWGEHAEGERPPAATSLGAICARGQRVSVVAQRATRRAPGVPIAGVVAFAAAVGGLVLWAVRTGRRRRARGEQT